MSLRDEDAWTGELMAIVDQPPEGDEAVAEAVVVEDAGEPQHVVNGSSSNGSSANGNGSNGNGSANGTVGKLKPLAPQAKAEPMVEKPKPPSPFAGPATRSRRR